MTIRKLIEFVAENPSRWDAPIFVLTQTENGFAMSPIERIEIDEVDSDFNFILHLTETQCKITSLREIQDAVMSHNLTALGGPPVPLLLLFPAIRP